MQGTNQSDFALSSATSKLQCKFMRSSHPLRLYEPMSLISLRSFQRWLNYSESRPSCRTVRSHFRSWPARPPQWLNINSLCYARFSLLMLMIATFRSLSSPLLNDRPRFLIPDPFANPGSSNSNHHDSFHSNWSQGSSMSRVCIYSQSRTLPLLIWNRTHICTKHKPYTCIKLGIW
jgi:hypothetical protein